MQMEPTNNGTSVGSRDGFWTGSPKWWQWFYRECRENTWALRRGWLCRPLAGAVPPPLFTSDKRDASLVGGNCGIQKCDSVDLLSLVIKCLGGGVYKLGDLVVLIINKQPAPSGGQVNTHSCCQHSNAHLLTTIHSHHPCGCSCRTAIHNGIADRMLGLACNAATVCGILVGVGASAALPCNNLGRR
jgi:hypothetical protein